LEDAKGVTGSRKSEKDSQYNGQQKKDKRKDNNLQNIAQKTEDRTTRTPVKTGGEHVCSGRVGSSCFTSDIRHARMIVFNNNINRKWKHPCKKLPKQISLQNGVVLKKKCSYSNTRTSFNDFEIIRLLNSPASCQSGLTTILVFLFVYSWYDFSRQSVLVFTFNFDW
jgi:hypothetical protein